MTRSENPRTEPTGRTMSDVSHVNPYTGETTGQLFSRGPTVVADGGRASAVDDETGSRTMKDVSHTPPNASEDANRVFERGHETSVVREE